MNIRSLQAFEAVAGTLNFTKAAERLFITQPALSRLISALEQELGVRLLTRSTRSVTLTAEGELCIPWVQRLLAEYNGLLNAAERSRRSMMGVLNIGYNPLAGQPDFFVVALAKFSEKFPNVEVSVRRDYSYQLVDGVCGGELDCALVSQAYLEELEALEFLPMQPVQLYALMRSDEALAQAGEIAVKQLEGATLTFMKESAPKTYNHVVRVFGENAVSFVEDKAVKDLEELILRVRTFKSVGMTSFVDPNHQYSDLTAVRIKEFPSSGRRGLAWRRDCKNPCVELFRDAAIEELKKY